MSSNARSGLIVVDTTFKLGLAQQQQQHWTSVLLSLLLCVKSVIVLTRDQFDASSFACHLLSGPLLPIAQAFNLTFMQECCCCFLCCCCCCLWIQLGQSSMSYCVISWKIMARMSQRKHCVISLNFACKVTLSQAHNNLRYPVQFD